MTEIGRLLVSLVLAAFLAVDAHARDSESIDLGYRFLETMMDQNAGKVVVYTEPEWSQFFPAVTGDARAVTLDARAGVHPHGGRSSFAIHVDPAAQGGAGWSGVYFLYPENNWGGRAGRDLTGATRISFWARADRKVGVRFQSGGINRAKGWAANAPHADSYGPVGSGEIALDNAWTQHSIDLAGQDLTSVIGDFAVVSQWTKDAPAYSIELDDVVIERPGQDQPRFLQSYAPSACRQDEAPNSAHVYDQALALLAFIARGMPGDLRRADLLARALTMAQERDRTFHDGRLRNAYAAGELIDPDRGTTRLPGRWNEAAKAFHEDSYAVGSHTGNLAWAAIALVQAHAMLPAREGNPYMRAAERLARWIVEHTKVEDTLGGFSGGYEGFETAAGKPEGQEKLLFRSTEHNIDLVALFELLSAQAGRATDKGRYWETQREHARRLVDAMRSDAGGPYLWTGTIEPTTEPNRSPVPLDVQAWSVLGLGRPDAYRDVLDWALANCPAGSVAGAFDFDCRDGDGAWWEGTAQMAAAMRWLGRDAETALEPLRRVQLRAEGPGQGGMPAASRCSLTTGFMRQWGPRNARETKPWTYSNAPHVAATAWYLFAAQGRNPFALAVRR